MNLLKFLMIVLGTISLCIGLIGIVVPGLPTTSFLLLTAGLYIRSSDKLYHKLITNKIVGPYILDFYSKRGMTKRVKVYSISIMWLMITLSCLLFISSFSLRLIVIIVGIIGTLVMGFIVPTIKDTDI